MYECIFVMLTELELKNHWWWCLRYCLSFSVSIKKGGGTKNNTDKITKLLRILLLIAIKRTKD